MGILSIEILTVGRWDEKNIIGGISVCSGGDLVVTAECECSRQLNM